MQKLNDLKIKLFTDGADKAQVFDMARQAWIKGFTTNPSLLKKAGVKDYAAYGRDLVAAVPDRHISFEVFSDDIPEMMAQADVITTWGPNVYVKLPVTTTRSPGFSEASVMPTPCSSKRLSISSRHDSAVPPTVTVTITNGCGFTN